jgi:hypothetical protein
MTIKPSLNLPFGKDTISSNIDFVLMKNNLKKEAYL